MRYLVYLLQFEALDKEEAFIFYEQRENLYFDFWILKKRFKGDAIQLNEKLKTTKIYLKF
jgi:hypothetical protein